MQNKFKIPASVRLKKWMIKALQLEPYIEEEIQSEKIRDSFKSLENEIESPKLNVSMDQEDSSEKSYATAPQHEVEIWPSQQQPVVLTKTEKAQMYIKDAKNWKNNLMEKIYG